MHVKFKYVALVSPNVQVLVNFHYTYQIQKTLE